MVNLRKGNFIFQNIPKKGDRGNLSKLIKNHCLRRVSYGPESLRHHSKTHGSLQVYFREIFCPGVGISEFIQLFMLNSIVCVKMKSLIESENTKI